MDEFTREAAVDVVAATERLRADLRVRGPLLEPVDGNSVSVTFVWIGPDERVSLRGAQIFTDHNAMSHPMTKVPGTDVWHISTVAPVGVTTTYQFLVDDPFPTADRADLGGLVNPMMEARLRSYADPFTDRRLYPQASVIAKDGEVPLERWESVLELPGLEPVDWFDERGAPAGTFAEHQLTSEALGNERTVVVQRPAVYRATGDPHPLVILLDGECWPTVARLDLAVDNLVADGKIPAPVVVYLNNPGDFHTRMAEMTCNPALPTMLADELLPLLRKEYNISPDPARTVLAGDSLTGLAATHAAFDRPDAFGNVLSCSGSHWWGFSVDGEPEWLTRQCAEAPRKPIRFWVDVGVLETGIGPMAPGVDPRAANRHFRTVLRARGYDVTYHDAPGGHDFATFRRSVVLGLRTLMAVDRAGV